ncbi:SKP1-like protein [Aphelenchoides bicaudatus]|nr:SKP1-like protein [Aphelenchoides bicaudatus]
MSDLPENSNHQNAMNFHQFQQQVQQQQMMQMNNGINFPNFQQQQAIPPFQSPQVDINSQQLMQFQLQQYLQMQIQQQLHIQQQIQQQMVQMNGGVNFQQQPPINMYNNLDFSQFQQAPEQQSPPPQLEIQQPIQNPEPPQQEPLNDEPSSSGRRKSMMKGALPKRKTPPKRKSTEDAPIPEENFERVISALENEARFHPQNMTGYIFKKVAEWCKRHPEPIDPPKVEIDPHTHERRWFLFDQYHTKFFEELDMDELEELITAADQFNVGSLYLFACQAAAARLKGKTPAEVRALLELPDDLTEDEKKEICGNNIWCNYTQI